MRDDDLRRLSEEEVRSYLLSMRERGVARGTLMGRKTVYRVDVDGLGGRCQPASVMSFDHAQTQW